MIEQIGMPHSSKGVPFRWRTCPGPAYTANPDIVSACPTTNALKETVLQHLDLDDNAHVSDFWYRVE